MLDLKIENIPEYLKSFNNWVGFKIEDGRKVPIDPKITGDGGNASISNPETWGSFEQAVSLVRVGMCVAVGFAITKETGLIFIDLDYHSDGLPDEEKDKLKKHYEALCRTVSYYNTYMEQSLSGDGVHLLARGSLDNELKQGKSTSAPVEIYNDKRFVIVTGHKLNDYDIEDDERTVGAIQIFHKTHFAKQTATNLAQADKSIIPPQSGELYSDDKVLQIALKNKDFNLLWNNQWDKVMGSDGSQKFTTQHYADFSLIRRLTYYTGNCPTQVERLFRQSPTFQAYGKNGKWVKIESDIQTDIKSASSTCTTVYTPNATAQDTGTGGVWYPDFPKILSMLQGDKDTRLIKNPALVELLTDYITKYQDKEKIQYIPYLFKEDRNINGATAIVKKVLRDNLKYSYNFSGFYIWDGKRFVDYGDAEILIHPLTEILALVEHSVFHYIMTYVVLADDGEKEVLEERAIKLFLESKRYVDSKLAKDVLKKYKGMDIGNDLPTYYNTPYINMQNGVFNLTTRELLPHLPVYNQHKIMNCTYDQTAACPTFEGMMARLLPNEDDRKELQKAFGLCLAKEQLPAKKVLMLLVGPKDTGKTTVLNTVVELLGEYGTSVDNSVLMQNGKEKNKGPEMYDFRETLMITTSESNENDKLDTGRVKALTGETTQSVKNNYATKVDKFKMIGLIFIDSNFKPYIPPKDAATWGRIRLFPFVCPITEKDPTLKIKLSAEKTGIFNWIMRGLDMVLEDKEIFETPAMLAYKEQYKGEMDVVEQFINDCIERTESAADRILTAVLYSTYKNWCKDNGFRESIRNKFYEEISKYYEKKKSGSDYFINISFTSLGNLYSRMGEKTAQQFAKDKRNLLETPAGDLPYSVLRKVYFSKSKEWFLQHIEYKDDITILLNRYCTYCDWCIEERILPLKAEDFYAKVHYIKNNLTSSSPTPELMEKAKDVWGS